MENTNPNNKELLKLKEENEHLEKQLTNMFNVMSLTSELTMSLDIDEVYKNILDLLVVSIGSHRHSISTIDDAGFLKVVASKFGDDEVDFEHAVLDKGIPKKVMETKQLFLSEDLSQKNPEDIVGCIPLIVEDKVSGLVTIHELLSHKKGFTDDDMEIFNMISTQAGYAIAAAKAYEKTKKEVEKKDEEITRLYDVSSLVTSALDINEVLDITLESVSDMLVCDSIGIFLYNEDTDNLVLRKSMGMDPELLESYVIIPGEGISGKVFDEKKPVLIKDMKHEVRYIHLIETEEAKLYSGSILSVPIMVKDRPIGVITVSKFKGGRFLDVPEKRILTTVAAQTAIGIDNAYQYEKQEKELVKVSSLFVATNQLHSTLDIDEIYKISNELLVDFIGASTFMMLLLDDAEKKLDIVLSRGIDQEIVDNASVSIQEKIIGQSIKDGKSFIVTAKEKPPVYKMEDQSFEIIACIPLRVENKIVGAIVINELSDQKNPFITIDKDLFDLMAKSTATAIIRAQMFVKSDQKVTSKYDLSRLLTIEYDVKNSIDSVLRLLHNNIPDIKSSVLIFQLDEKKNKKYYKVISQRGYSEEEMKTFNCDEKIKALTSISLGSDEKEVGLLCVESIVGKEFSEKELDVFGSAGKILSEFVCHDKNFKLSKNLAIMLSKEKTQSNAIVKGVADGLLVTDLQDNLMLVNPILEKIFQFEERDVIGGKVNEIIKNNKLLEILERTKKKEFVEDAIKLERGDEILSFQIKSSLVKDEKKNAVGVVTILHDITKEKEAEKVKNDFLKKLKKISITDALTDVYNRRYFEKRIAEEYARAVRYGTAFSCIMLDADYFKKINDTYGHKVGDDVLVFIAKTIKKNIRTMDMVARYGGEEFILILPETEAEDALVVAERLRKTIESEILKTKEGQDFKVTVSLGISGYPHNNVPSANDIVKSADDALYLAKSKGRNNTVIYNGQKSKS